MDMSSLTVLIPTHGRPKLLERTLASLTECILPDSYRELVVIENGSRAGAEGIVACLSERMRARYMHEEWGNKSNALNVALETIGEGLVVFFDDDVRVEPNTLVAYADTAQDYERGVFFGGPVEVDRESEPPDWIAPRFPSSVRGFDLVDRRMAEDKFVGFNWAAFAEDIIDLGGFDPRFGPGSPADATGQEGDMQDRMLAAGMQSVDVSEAWVSHYVPAENVTLQWLLKRRVRDGAGAGIRAKSRGLRRFFAHTVRELFISLGVLLMGVGGQNYEKVSISLCQIFWALGKAKGYLHEAE